MRRRSIACAVVLAAVSTAAPAAGRQQPGIHVSATLSSARIHVGESTVLQVRIETDGAGAESIDLPSLPPALEIGGTQDFNQLQLTGASGRTRLIEHNVTLFARVPGTFTIPPTTVRIDNRLHRTAPVTLTVLPGPGTGPAPVESGGRDVVLRAWLTPDRAYVGQQVMLRAEALFPRDLRLRQARPASYQAPSPAGFWTQDMPDAITTGIRSIDGEIYETQTFSRAYFALQPGPYVMEPARLVYQIRRGYLLAAETRELASDSLRLTVLPLPEEGKPAGFAGAVGDFTMTAALSPDTITAGDAAILTVEIRGTGNVKALPPPRLPDLPGVEVYPPAEDARVDVRNGRFGGVKRFTWVLAPERPGPMLVPSLEYAFYDPNREAYEIARSGAHAVTVLPARGTVESMTDTSLLPLKPRGSGTLSWVRTPWFAALQAVPLLAIAVALLLRRTADRPERHSRRRIRAERLAALDALRADAATVDGDRTFFDRLGHAIRDALVALLERDDVRNVTTPLLRQCMEAADVTPETAAAIADLIARIDNARFAAGSATAAQRTAMIGEARRLLDQVDRARPRRPHLAATAALIPILIAPALLMAPTHAAAALQRESDPFAGAAAAYAEGRYQVAMEGFGAYVRTHSRDAAGWYDLGNAYYAAGHRGHAVWAWVRGLRIDPRLAAARRNLTIAGAPTALGAAPPAFTPTFEQALLAAAALWWIAGLLIALRLGRRRSARAPLIATVLIPLVLAAAALPRLRDGSEALVLAPATPLRGGPALKSEQIQLLDESASVDVLERRNGWIRVRTDNGREGWVEQVALGAL